MLIITEELHACTCDDVMTMMQSTDLQFVCYDDPECAANITRPVFTEGVSVEECCEMPHITSVWDRLMESCMDCGE